MTEPWLDGFLRRQFAAAHAGGRCVRIALKHMGGKYMAVHGWDFAEQPDEDAWDGIAREILEATQQDVDARGGRQRYVLCAYYAEAPGIEAESRAFLRQGKTAEGEDGDAEPDSEGPTPKGLQVQTMRHLEAVMRLAVVGQQQVQDVQAKTIKAQNDRLASMDARYFEMLRMTEELHTQRHDRDLATKESEVKLEMWREGLERAKVLVPLAVNAMAGQRLLPELVSPAMEMVGSLVGSITPDQLQQLFTVLKPEQVAVLMTLLRERQQLLAPEAPPNGGAKADA